MSGEDYSSIDDIMTSSKPRSHGIPPPLPGSNSPQGQNEYLNPSYRSPPPSQRGDMEGAGRRGRRKVEWWVWILMGLCMVSIIMLILILVFTFYDNCREPTPNKDKGTSEPPGECARFVPRHVNFSCADLRMSGVKMSGVYTIYPRPDSPVQVFCDMETNAGGWTVIQRRINGSVNFYRGWSDYLQGFGEVDGEYWLGLENLHTLTHGEMSSLYVHLEDWENSTRYAEYAFFYITASLDGYRLLKGAYSGDAGDGLTIANTKTFSTKDHGSACSARTQSAWWLHGCYSNLNGVYLRGKLNSTDARGMVWRGWRGLKYSLKSTRMMVRPVDFVYTLINCGDK